MWDTVTPAADLGKNGEDVRAEPGGRVSRPGNHLTMSNHSSQLAAAPGEPLTPSKASLYKDQTHRGSRRGSLGSLGNGWAEGCPWALVQHQSAGSGPVGRGSEALMQAGGWGGVESGRRGMREFKKDPPPPPSSQPAQPLHSQVSAAQGRGFPLALLSPPGDGEAGAGSCAGGSAPTRPPPAPASARGNVWVQEASAGTDFLGLDRNLKTTEPNAILFPRKQQ